MKKQIIRSMLLGVSALFLLSSCNNWLEVTPKSQIIAEKHFSREDGYNDQLIGVYTAMASRSMYGLQMGVGFTEVLSQNYDVNAGGIWRYAAEYNYKDSEVESIINSIWKSTYSCIANLNLMLQYINKANPNIFLENHHQLYKGEALGLRAFLHFDLMRLFACAPAMDNQAPGVPYVTEYITDIAQQKSVGETMKLIINDLLEAKSYLEQDSLRIGSSPYYQRATRRPRFNYYAAVSTLARAYMWMGDTENALVYANEIIDVVEDNQWGNPFSWSWSASSDCLFEDGQVFYLTLSKWDEISDAYFLKDAGNNVLTLSETNVDAIYELHKGYGADPRCLNGYVRDGGDYYFRKFALTGSATSRNYPLIRMTEAYYIAAECLKNTDPARAVELLETVRENRQIEESLGDLFADEIQAEIYKEYRKEFIGESQLFYYYKRLNASQIEGTNVRPDKNLYVLPVPSNDVEFGGYAN